MKLNLLTPILAGLQARGIDPDPLLDRVGLTQSAVDDPDTSVHVMVVHHFLENCANAANDRTFCATIGLQADPSGWPMIQLAARTATTLGDFLNIYVTHASEVASSVTPYLEVRGARATFGEERRFEPQIIPAQNDGFMTGLHIGLLEQIMGAAMQPGRVFLVLSDPSVLPEALGRYQTLRGDKMGTRIQFPSEWLTRPVNTTLSKQDPGRSARRNLQGDYLTDVRDLLRQNIGNGGLSAGEAAALLHIGQRSLARRLAALNTSISKELALARIAHAKFALRHTRRSINDIASDLGYSDPSNFTRAFARAAHMSPTDFRSGAPEA